MRKLVIIIGIVVLVIVGLIVFMLSGMKQIKEMKIENVDLNQVQDGTYSGEFKGYRWSNRVEVTVYNHQITELKIVKDVKFPLAAVTKILFDQILLKQTLQVDTVSNATVNSKAYLKAIENALIRARK